VEVAGEGHVAAFQELEQALGVFLFLAGGLLKDGGNLLVPLFPGLHGEEGVLVPSLALAHERGHDVLFRLRSLQTLHGVLLGSF